MKPSREHPSNKKVGMHVYGTPSIALRAKGHHPTSNQRHMPVWDALT